MRQLPRRRIVLATTAQIRGGVWRHIADVGVVLQALGADAVLALVDDATELKEAAKAIGLRWIPFGRSVFDDSAVWHMHLHNTYDPLAVACVMARRCVGPTVITEHLPHNYASDAQLEPHYSRRRGAYTGKTLLKRAEFWAADITVAVGSSSARFIEDRYQLPEDRLRVIHNGIGVTAGVFEPPALTGEPLEVLALGSLVRQKGFDLLLQAAIASERPWRVTFAGTGSQAEALRELSSQLPTERVRFVGWLNDPLAAVLNADVICMPSRWEAFPYAALEALARSRPVVGTRVDGIDEIVDETCGVLIDSERPDLLAAALDQLDGDRALLQHLAAGGPARAARFNLARMIGELLSAYQAAGLARRPHHP